MSGGSDKRVVVWQRRGPDAWLPVAVLSDCTASVSAVSALYLSGVGPATTRPAVIVAATTTGTVHVWTRVAGSGVWSLPRSHL